MRPRTTSATSVRRMWRARWAAATAVTVALVALTGCSSEQPRVEGQSPAPTTTTTEPSASPTPSPTLSSAEREARDRTAVEQAWLGYNDTLRLLTSEDPGIPESEWYEVMSRYAVEDAARQNVAALQDQRQRGLVSYGGDGGHRLFWETDIAGGDLAQIWDCQDSSQSGLMVAETGEKLTAGRANDRVEGQLVLGADGQWRVQEIIYHTSEPC